MARTSSRQDFLLPSSTCSSPEGFWKLRQPNVPEEEQGDPNMKHFPWTVPLRRNSRGKEKGHFSYNFSSEGDFYFSDSEEEVHTIEGKKEDSSDLCKVKHFNLSSFDNY